MNFLSWNCRELGNSRTVWILGDLIKSRKPDFLYLSETLVTSDKIHSSYSRYYFSKTFVLDCNGRSGGLTIFWKRNFDCNVTDLSINHIDVLVNKDGIAYWRMT